VAIKTVDIAVSQFLADLENGLTWFKSEDIGAGSIEEKYGAKEFQVKTIMKHPKLVGKEPNIIVFRIIDDTKDDKNVINKELSASRQPEPATGNTADPSADSKENTKQIPGLGNSASKNVSDAAQEDGQTDKSGSNSAAANKGQQVLPMGTKQPGLGISLPGLNELSKSTVKEPAATTAYSYVNGTEAGDRFLEL
jgi:hypothetical protein